MAAGGLYMYRGEAYSFTGRSKTARGSTWYEAKPANGSGETIWVSHSGDVEVGGRVIAETDRPDYNRGPRRSQMTAHDSGDDTRAIAFNQPFAHKGRKYLATGLVKVTKDDGSQAFQFQSQDGDVIWVTAKGKVYSSNEVGAGKVHLPQRSDSLRGLPNRVFTYKGLEYTATGKMRMNPKTGETEYEMESGRGPGRKTIWADAKGNVEGRAYDENDAVPNDLMYKGKKYWPTMNTRVNRHSGKVEWEMEAADGSGKIVWLDLKGRVSERSDEAAVEKRGAFTYKGIEFWATGRTKTENGRKWYEMESEEAYLIWVDTSGNVVEDKHGFGPSHKISGRRSDDAAVERRPTTHAVTYTASDEDEVESRGRMPEDPVTYKGKTWYLTGKTGPAPGNLKEQVWQLEAVDSNDRPTGERIWMNASGRIYPD